MASLPLVVASCFLGFCFGGEAPPETQTHLSPLAAQDTAYFAVVNKPYEKRGAGDFLASRFAQQNHDWKNANYYNNALLREGHSSPEILGRAMVLAMGAGDSAAAFDFAKKIKAQSEDSASKSIAQLFLIAQAMSQDQWEEAQKMILTLPDEATANFIKPFLEGWSNAAHKKVVIDDLKSNTVQIYHAILISDFLDSHEKLQKLLDKNVVIDNINPADLERVGDIYAHAKLKEKAIAIYEQVQKIWPDDPSLAEKIKAVKDGTNKQMFERVKTAKDGMSRAFHDIAEILFQDYNDESARIFANLSLTLMPDKRESKFLLAEIAARHNQFDEAISYYKAIPESDEMYLPAQFKVAGMLDETDRFAEALVLLEGLKGKGKDVEVLESIGDLYRSQDDFQKALNAYNAAVEKLGGSIPEENWSLHYARGICHEQLGNWDKAEIELKSALALQPDQAYVLNYLGYGWADRGMNLNEARDLIQKAVDLRPSDGYIVDSLGWVQYKMGGYSDAVRNLEKAVALLPYDPTINDHLGDAYWRAGRHREARFQWQRAKNQSTDSKQIETLHQKLENGLENDMNDDSSRIGANTQNKL